MALDRRAFLRVVGGGAVITLAACEAGGDDAADSSDSSDGDGDGDGDGADAAPGAPDAAAGGADATPGAPDAAPACAEHVTMYDTYAVALYFDGGIGPLTGTITVAMVLADQPVLMEFWHGHGGQQHMFTMLPEHFADLKKGKKVMVQTTEVDAHQHFLFIDPKDPQYRVEGAEPVQVPIC